MPSTTLLEIPPAEQVQMRAILRRARYGYLLAFHILLLCAAGRNPTEIAAFLLCSRSSVYRIVRAYRAGSLNQATGDSYTHAASLGCCAAAICSPAAVTSGAA